MPSLPAQEVALSSTLQTQSKTELLTVYFY